MNKMTMTTEITQDIVEEINLVPGDIEGYHFDEYGILHQTDFDPITYDEKYLDYYDGLKERTVNLGYLRLGYLLTKIMHRGHWMERYDNEPLNSILEIGYGPGSFLSAAKKYGIEECYGNDITQFPLPEGCHFIDWEDLFKRKWDCVAMYDVLEHIPDITFLKDLKTKFLVLSVPYCDVNKKGVDWFMNWRMRLPNEHLHHFNVSSLNAFLRDMGYVVLDINDMEDGLRLREGETGPNIITGLYGREDIFA
jgi:hypothetical protein